MIGGDDETGHATVLQRSETVGQAEHARGHRGHRGYRRRGIQPTAHHAPQVRPQVTRSFQPLCGEGEFDARSVQSLRIVRCQFPLLQLLDGDLHRLEGILHIVRFRKRKRQDELLTGRLDLGQARVLITGALHDEDPCELPAEPRDAQFVVAVGGLDDPWQRALIVQRLQIDVALFRATFTGVPLCVVERLAEQGDGPHQRGGIVGAGAAPAEAELGGNSGNEQILLVVAASEQDSSTSAARDAVVEVGDHQSEALFTEFPRAFLVRLEQCGRPT